MRVGTPFLLGMAAGSRSMTPPAAVAWAARSGRLPAAETALAFLARPQTGRVLTALALGEIAADKLPGVPSRTAIGPFAFRLLSGGVCGAAVGLPRQAGAGLVAGMAGAAVGTVLATAVRSRLARGLGGDVPAALLEDAVVVLASAALLYRNKR